MTELERYESLRHCRWVDEVIPDAPWVLTKEFIDKHQIDFVAHDALPYADTSGAGKDVYELVKSLGKFKETKRTDGVSTSDVIMRILKDYNEYVRQKKLFPNTYLLVGCCNDEVTHRYKGKTVMTELERYESLRHCRWVDEVIPDAPWVLTKEFIDKHQIDFVAHDALPYADTSGAGKDVYELVKSLGKFKETKRTDGVSTSDVIMRILKDYNEYVRQKKLFPNTYLLVGCCNDEVTHRYKGKTVMTELERYESLRHCRWVDEVIPDAPWVLTKEFIDKHQIDFVAHDALPYADTSGAGKDVYELVKSLGKFKETKRTDGVSTSDVIMRILKDYNEYVRQKSCFPIHISSWVAAMMKLLTGTKEKQL